MSQKYAPDIQQGTHSSHGEEDYVCRNEHGCLIDRVRAGPQSFDDQLLLALAHKKIGGGTVEDEEETVEEALQHPYLAAYVSRGYYLSCSFYTYFIT